MAHFHIQWFYVWLSGNSDTLGYVDEINGLWMTEWL
jgi:hypothetical protein